VTNTKDEQARHPSDELSLHQPNTSSCKKINFGATPPPDKNKKGQTNKQGKTLQNKIYIHKKKHKTKH